MNQQVYKFDLTQPGGQNVPEGYTIEKFLFVERDYAIAVIYKYEEPRNTTTGYATTGYGTVTTAYDPTAVWRR